MPFQHAFQPADISFRWKTFQNTLCTFRLSFNFHLKLVNWNSSCRATDWILILGVRLTVCGSKEIQVGLAILKSSILYIFWGARKPRNGFEQSLFKCGCAQNVLFVFFSGCESASSCFVRCRDLQKASRARALCVPCTVFLFTSSSDSEALMHLS